MTTTTLEHALTSAYAALNAVTALHVAQPIGRPLEASTAYLDAADFLTAALLTLGEQAHRNAETSFGLVAARFVEAMHDALKNAITQAWYLLTWSQPDADPDQLKLPLDAVHRALLAMTAALEHESEHAS